MSLFLRPNSDYSTLNWNSTDPGALFSVINEVNLDEVHNISTFGSFADAEAMFTLPAPPASPISGITCFARCYASKQNNGSIQSFEIRLYQGPSPTLIASQAFALTTATVLCSLSFSSSLVSSWANLIVGFYRGPTVAANGAFVYQGFLEIPGFRRLNSSGPGLAVVSEASGISLQSSGPGIAQVSGAEGTGALIELVGNGFTAKS